MITVITCLAIIKSMVDIVRNTLVDFIDFFYIIRMIDSDDYRMVDR